LGGALGLRIINLYVFVDDRTQSGDYATKVLVLFVIAHCQFDGHVERDGEHLALMII
jgi:hypothetical protein